MKILIAFVLVSLAVLLLISCNTVRKSVQKEKSSSDSTGVSTSEAASRSTYDSSGSRMKTGDYEKETIWAYDTVYNVIKGDTVRVYVPRIVRVYEKGSFTKIESAGKTVTDSVSFRQLDSTAVMKTSESKVLQRKSSRVPVALIIAGVIALAVVVCFTIFIKRIPKSDTWIN